MRVCIVCASLPPYYGGAALRALRYAQRLQAAQDNTAAIVVGWDRLETRSGDDALPDNVFPVRLKVRRMGGARFPSGSLATALHLVEASLRLGRLLFSLRQRFDLLHVIDAGSLFNLASIPIAQALGKPVILEMTLLGADDPLTLNRRHGNPEEQLFPHRPLKYSLFLMADAYVSKSAGLSAVYRQAGLPEGKLFQIPSSVDAQRFRPPSASQKRSLREQLGLPQEQTIILFVGGIEKRKGVHRLIAAFREVALRHLDTHLLIVGPTDRFSQDYVRALHDRVEEWDLSERVTFVSELVKNVDEYMQAADVFALPSSREGLSVAILEAMASGLPIVASDIPEVAHSQINHGIEGLLVQVGDVEGLSKRLAELVSDTETRGRLGSAARQRVLRQFTPEIVDHRYMDLYAQCLERR